MVCYIINLIDFVLIIRYSPTLIFFFFNDTATTEIYTLSLHDALPICRDVFPSGYQEIERIVQEIDVIWLPRGSSEPDRKSTRLNSSHSQISYAVFCLKKKKKII